MGFLKNFQAWLERTLFLPSEVEGPALRFPKILHLLVILVSTFIELFLAVWALYEGLGYAAALHGALMLGFMALLIFLPKKFSPRWFSAAFMAGFALAIGISMSGAYLGAYLWLFVSPASVLFVTGPVVGVVFGALLLVGMLAFGWLGAWPLDSFWFSLATFGAACLMTAISVFLYLIRATFAFYEEQQHVLAELLTNSRINAARYADQNRFLETLLDLIPFPLFYKDMEGSFLTANSSFSVIFDASKEHVVGKKNEEFLVPHNAKTLAKIELDVLARDSMAAEETQLVHADGKLHDFIVYMMPFVDSQQSTQGYIGVLIDITERKQKEQKLVMLNDTKDQLFSIISHDLRGPVGKIKQLLDVYVEDQGIFDRATWDHVFQDMRKSSDSLFQLLENLLSWARSQRGDSESLFELFALEPLVVEVFELQKLMATDKNIQLVHDIQLTGPVLTDKHILSTIIRNLVNNALKFTRNGGTVTVRAGETVDEVFISVEDSGIGMSPQTIEKIFNKRQRVTTYGTGKEKGQGIGLGLCIDLTAAIGAEMTIESLEGQGTQIRLHLPTMEL